MSSIMRRAAAAMVAGTAMLAGGAASAVAVDFGTQPGNYEPYVEDGFSFDVANLTNGQCPDGTCLLQNNGANMMTTLTSQDGGSFDLLGFTYHFIGDTQQQRATLTLTDTITRMFTQEEYGNDPFTITFNDEFQGVNQIKFTYAGPGTGRLDNLVLEGGGNGGQPNPIPLPASLPLLMGALAGIGFLTRRRRAS